VIIKLLYPDIMPCYDNHLLSEIFYV